MHDILYIRLRKKKDEKYSFEPATMEMRWHVFVLISYWIVLLLFCVSFSWHCRRGPTDTKNVVAAQMYRFLKKMFWRRVYYLDIAWSGQGGQRSKMGTVPLFCEKRGCPNPVFLRVPFWAIPSQAIDGAMPDVMEQERASMACILEKYRGAPSTE